MLLLSSACYLLPQWVTLLDPFSSDIQDIQSISLWYFCHWLRYLSLVSRPGKYRACRPVKCSPTLYAEYLYGLIWWFNWAHAHIPGTHEPLGHWNSNVNTQILEEFPAGVPIEWTGMDTGPRVPVLSNIREEVRRERGTPRFLTSPSFHHWLRSGREGHRTFRETRPAHWTPHTPLREWNKARGTEMTDLAHRLESYYCWHLYTTKS